MNRQHTLFHLKEALEALQRTVTTMEADPMYSSGELSVELGHLYHHINTAWNAREASEQEVRTCTAADFNRWGRFPQELLWSPQDDD